MTAIDLNKANLDACRKYQAYYDEALCRHVGCQTPQPVAGQDVNKYRADCNNIFRKTFLPQTHSLGKIRYHHLVDHNQMVTFTELEKQNIAACRVEAFNPAYVTPGEFRMIIKRDPFGHETERVFIGPESFVKQMTRPGRRVVSFNTPNGPVDAGGRFLR
jgi:hypothetical protein